MAGAVAKVTGAVNYIANIELPGQLFAKALLVEQVGDADRAEQLVAAGEEVVDVPAKLAARVRVFDTGNARKTDATGARAASAMESAPVAARSFDPLAHFDGRRTLRQFLYRSGSARQPALRASRMTFQESRGNVAVSVPPSDVRASSAYRRNVRSNARRLSTPTPPANTQTPGMNFAA